MVAAIDEITQVPSNATVIKIMNALIKRYNSLANIYTLKGSVETYNDLLAIQNPTAGDVYNVKQEDSEHGVAAGSNFVWDGTTWDNLGMNLDGLVRKVNGFTPDDLGAVIFQYIKNIEDKDGTLIVTIRNGEEETPLTIQTGKVKTVNGVEPDGTGNISIEVPQLTIATQEEAEAGTDNTKFMTPLRTKQAINALMNAIPVGIILPFAGSTIPSGFLACNGAAVSRTTYSELFSVISTTYGSGDESTTFNLPNLEDNRFMEFSDTRGTEKNAGLPNITGAFNMQGFNEVANNNTYSVSGAFYMQSSTRWVGRGGGGASRGVAFDASRSNGLYGGSDTVQPKSLTVRAIIKY